MFVTLVSLGCLVVSGLSIGGGAYAAQKIGKDLVVTKSIKNGAVTTDKIKADAVDGTRVKDGSLTAVDLAPGTIPSVPVVPNGRSLMVSSIVSTTGVSGGSVLMSASGSYEAGSELIYSVAPTTLTVSHLQVRLENAEGAGQSRAVSLIAGPMSSVGTVLACTVTSGTQTCASSGTATINAGDVFYVGGSNNVPNGSSTGFMMVSFVVEVA